MFWRICVPSPSWKRPPLRLREVPRRVGEERRAAGEGEGHAGADDDPLRVLGDEQRHRHGVVHRLGHVQPVVAETLDPLRVCDGVPKGQARVHARIHLHDEESFVVCSLPLATIRSRSVDRRDWSKRSAIHSRDHRFSSARAAGPDKAPIAS